MIRSDISWKSVGFVLLTNQVHWLRSFNVGNVDDLACGLFFSFFLWTGLSDPYCEVSMGSQEHRTKVVPQTLNPKWNSAVSLAKRKTFYRALHLLCQQFRVSLPSIFCTLFQRVLIGQVCGLGWVDINPCCFVLLRFVSCRYYGYATRSFLTVLPSKEYLALPLACSYKSGLTQKRYFFPAGEFHS